MIGKQDMSLMEFYTRREVVATTLWLHGLGVNASDFNDVLKHLSRSRELGLHYLAPNAPTRRITVNDERPTRAWFDVLGDPAEVPEDRAGIEDSAGFIKGILDRERQQGMASENIIVAGFDQGAGMALHAGLRYGHPLAGIIVLAGELLLPDSLAEEGHPANAQTPILMLHGSDDEVVPVQDARRSRDRLLEQGYPVEWYEFPVGHGLTPEQVERIDGWIYERLAGA